MDPSLRTKISAIAFLELEVACANGNSLKTEPQSTKTLDYAGDRDLGVLGLHTEKLGTRQCISSPKYSSDSPDLAFQQLVLREGQTATCRTAFS